MIILHASICNLSQTTIWFVCLLLLLFFCGFFVFMLDFLGGIGSIFLPFFGRFIIIIIIIISSSSSSSSISSSILLLLLLLFCCCYLFIINKNNNKNNSRPNLLFGVACIYFSLYIYYGIYLLLLLLLILLKNFLIKA